MITTADVSSSSFVVVHGIFKHNEHPSGSSLRKKSQCRQESRSRKGFPGVVLVKARTGAPGVGGDREHGKTPVSTSRWVYRGNSLISQTVLQPVSTPKAAGPWRQGLLELIEDLLCGLDAKSLLEPWIDGLSVEECNKIIVEVGSRDWSLATNIFRFLREHGPYKHEGRNFSGGEAVLDSDEKTAVENSGTCANGLLKAYTTLIAILGRKGRLTELNMLLAEIEEEELKPDLRFYNVVAEAYSNVGMVSNIAELITLMERKGLQPDHATFELMIAAHLRADARELDDAIVVFRNMLRSKLEVGVKTYLKLIDACVDAGDVNAGDEVFTAMRSTAHQIYSKTWVKMIQLYANGGGVKRAEELFRTMISAGVLPTGSTYDALLVAYCRAGRLDQAYVLFREYKSVSKPSLVAYNCLIDATGKYGRYEESLALYSELNGSGLRPTTVTYTSLINAMVKGGQFSKADRLYKKMLQKNVVPNSHTVTIMLQAYMSCGWTRLGHEICLKMKDYKVEMTSLVFGSIVKLYIQGRWYKEAARVMKEMEAKAAEPDLAGYGVLIAALGDVGDEMAPFTNAMRASDWEPCRVAYFLTSVTEHRGSDFGGGERGQGLDLSKAWSYLEDAATCKDRETNRSFYNALMDALWRRGLRNRAQLVMLKARDLLPWYNRPRVGSSSSLDLRGLSVGGALVALLHWLQKASISPGPTPTGHVMVIYTGDGLEVGAGTRSVNLMKGRGVGAVKQAVTAYLEEQCSPFREDKESSPGRLHAETELVMKWLSKHDSKDALQLLDSA